MSSAALYIIPSSLAPSVDEDAFSHNYKQIVFSLRHFVVEQERTARRFLSQLGHPGPISELHFRVLNEHSTPDDLKDLVAFIVEDHPTGLLSEAGCPGIADPGADLVRHAHQRGVIVQALVGPSSIVLALMASGLNGQNFCFHGYLPREEQARRDQISRFESESRKRGETKVFIETPYRNRQLFRALTKHLHAQTHLALACELTTEKGWVQTKTVQEWKSKEPDIHKKNVVFSFLAQEPPKKGGGSWG